ncbi:MAG: hypothetical protein ABW250_06345 [Pyrinomonadaceae bacterium]
MKKFLAIALTFASVGFAASTAEAKAANPSNSVATATTMKAAPAAAQIWNRRNRRSRVRVTTQSRLVRVGRRVYRETYQVRYLPNGRTQTSLISRVRVR